MKRIRAALLALSAFAALPAMGQSLPVAADSSATPKAFIGGGFAVKAFGGLPGLAFSDPFNLTNGSPTWRALPIAPASLPQFSGPCRTTAAGTSAIVCDNLLATANLWSGYQSFNGGAVATISSNPFVLLFDSVRKYTYQRNPSTGFIMQTGTEPGYSGFEWWVTPIGSTTPVKIGTLGAVGQQLNVPLGLAGVFPLDLTYASTVNPNAVRLGAGNSLSICPALSCIQSPNSDHQRTSALFSTSTQDDGHSEEQTVAILTTVGTGFAKNYANSTAYQVGDNINANGQIYRVTTAGTSAASGSGPTGTSTTPFANGSVQVIWINSAAINAKVGLYGETQCVTGAGTCWGAAFNYQMQPGMVPTFNPAVEIDATNNAADCNIGAANCYGLLIGTGGNHRSTAGVYLTNDVPLSNYAMIWGFRTAGTMLASDAAFEDDSGAAIGFGVNTTGFAAGKHSSADFFANGLSPYGLVIGNTKGSAGILDVSTAPDGIKLQGKYAVAGLEFESAAPASILIGPGNTVGQIIGQGWSIDLSGNISGQAGSFAGPLTESSTVLMTTKTAFSNFAAGQTATLTNGPTAGNPTKWVPINDNGTVRYIPAW